MSWLILFRPASPELNPTEEDNIRRCRRDLAAQFGPDKDVVEEQLQEEVRRAIDLRDDLLGRLARFLPEGDALVGRQPVCTKVRYVTAAAATHDKAEANVERALRALERHRRHHQTSTRR